MKNIRIHLLLLIIISSSFLWWCYDATNSNVKVTLIQRRAILAPDGFNRSVITINDTFPGPNLRFKQNSTVEITVVNQLDESEVVSVHWHGIEQLGTPWSDGTAGVTNCPIGYSMSHTYVFNVNSTGTFWYHSHVIGMQTEGGYGLFIVEDSISDYEAEIPFIVSDWFHQEAHVIEAGLLSYGPSSKDTSSPTTGFVWPGIGQSILVNGVGGKKIYVDVDPGKQYRVRLLNAAALSYYNIAIAGHKMTLISTGGQQTNRTVFNSLDIAPAQRYDFLITTPTVESLYKIKIQTNWRGADTTNASVYDIVYLRVGKSDSISNLQPMNENKAWNDQVNKIFPLNNDNYVIPNPTQEFIFDMRQQYVDEDFQGLDIYGRNTNGYLRWTVNQKAYMFTATPLLLSSYYGMLDDQHYHDATLPISIKKGAIVQIIIQNRVALNGICEQHPWHIHGFDFWLVGNGEGQYNQDTDSKKLNTSNVIQVDTVVNYPSQYGDPRDNPRASGHSEDVNKPCGWTAVRFNASNPGLWIFHCHIEWHLSLGMAVVFDVDSKSLWSQKNGLPDSYGYCGQITDKTTNPWVDESDDSCDSKKGKVIMTTAHFIIMVVFSCFGAFIIGGIFMPFLYEWIRQSRFQSCFRGNNQPSSTLVPVVETTPLPQVVGDEVNDSDA